MVAQLTDDTVWNTGGIYANCVLLCAVVMSHYVWYAATVMIQHTSYVPTATYHGDPLRG
jgi:hypothetical protein